MTSPNAPTTTEPAPTVVVVSGNPRPGSRTLGAAETAARRIAAHLGIDGVTTIDLATFAAEILAPEHPAADAAKERLAGAAVAVIATPVYKAAYTGLLKSFLDLYGNDGLAGVVAVPLVVSGNPGHALAGEVHLRPVLVELGAVVPARSLTVTEGQLADLDGVLEAWLDRGGEALRRAVDLDGAGVPAGVGAGVAAGVGEVVR
jgi:FMN reductase